MSLKVTLLCFLMILSWAEFIWKAEALESGEEGVCVVNLSVRKTRNKMVTINKWCGKKKCVVKKVETYTEPQKRILCCNGWEYNTQDDRCSPICSTGCEGGRCTGPDVCSCEPPSYLDPEHRNICIQPTCSPRCVNADCVANNICQCKPDFTSFNLTHCIKCDPGYSFDSNFNCQPICDTDCVNGNCTAPNTCTCVDGYRSKDNFTCEPICDCVNATCIAPNTCSCFDGYEKFNETTCIPKCDSCDGDCVGPNICKCREGYFKTGGNCKPVCEVKCVNGFCSEPNVCSCNEGFVKNDSDPKVCDKDCKQPTVTVKM